MTRSPCANSYDELISGFIYKFVNLHAVELPQLRGQRRVDGVESPTQTQRYRFEEGALAGEI